MKEFLANLKRHVLTGVSYMIPFTIAGAVIMGIARVGGMIYGVTDIWDASHKTAQGLIPFFHTLDGLGGLALGLMLPVFAGFIAYSIADRPGLVAGFVGGVLANNLGTGFLGALAAGLIAGYIVSFMANNIKLPESASSIIPVFILPVFGTLFTVLIMQYIIGQPFSALNNALVQWMSGMSTGSSSLVLALVVGGMVGFDLGGPINKAAVVTAMALISEGLFIANTAAQVAIIIPTLGYGLATFIKRKKFSSELSEAGKASFIMGLVGISEGAIPFTLVNPVRMIPVNVVGCAVGAATAVSLGAVNSIPISGIYGWLLVEKWPVYVLGILVGSLIVAAGAILFGKGFDSDDVESVV
ncbi:PTS fructose transporter subunit IIC [Clostridium beijerinckii]|uniref:PTS fructose transporter subunit IIC n=1 Tax=Clostridium beijerinckii TaxID=1520 RepID=A0AAW3W4I6_CLOBE|nr:PTS fructose transporter subunit IIC [Clostridium beijerinckii]MBC2456097.1 PTS fructose transporter subunit IIC [Clostridium beijerinckii]MBC2473644.1 PTS fructose transporter subunit IIC [Clostridium beijerinckii]NOV62985.1 PTS system fructose-specific IIC component [Clostridium beijerinckii]NOV70053.1 PTS system fructose-specific IIC component [Clostridium beijerinckii]NOW31040.1 PTS system fructose-specific IIC component [Clostridium beijerinckii]